MEAEFSSAEHTPCYAISGIAQAPERSLEIEEEIDNEIQWYYQFVLFIIIITLLVLLAMFWQKGIKLLLS